MRRVVLYIASTLDGYIAGQNHELDWLMDGADYGYDEFIGNVDHIISGRKTIDVINDFEWYYAKQTVTVVTSNRDYKSKHPIQLLHDDVSGFVKRLKSESGGDIWLLGGGELIRTFLREGLLDEMLLFVHPILLGGGIPMFPGVFGRIDWQLKEVKPFENGVVLMHYLRRIVD